MARRSVFDTVPDDLFYEVVWFLSFNDVMKTWRRVNKSCHQLVENYYAHQPVKSFDSNHGHWRLLPAIVKETVQEFKSPLATDDSYTPWGTRKSVYGKWSSVERMRVVDADWPESWLRFFFAGLERIDFSSTTMSENITDLGVFHLGTLAENCGTRITHLNISNCGRLSGAALRYLRAFLDQGLEKLVAKNIPQAVLHPCSGLPTSPFFFPLLTGAAGGGRLKTLDLSENQWLNWSDVAHFLRAAPQLECLNLSKTSVGVRERIDFLELECRHTLRDLLFNDVVDFLKENEESILLSCPQLEARKVSDTSTRTC